MAVNVFRLGQSRIIDIAAGTPANLHQTFRISKSEPQYQYLTLLSEWIPAGSFIRIGGSDGVKINIIPGVSIKLPNSTTYEIQLHDLGFYSSSAASISEQRASSFFWAWSDKPLSPEATEMANFAETQSTLYGDARNHFHQFRVSGITIPSGIVSYYQIITRFPYMRVWARDLVTSSHSASLLNYSIESRDGDSSFAFQYPDAGTYWVFTSGQNNNSRYTNQYLRIRPMTQNSIACNTLSTTMSFDIKLVADNG